MRRSAALPVLAALLLTLLASATASAQGAPVDPTPEQRKLAQDALDAFQAGRYDDTIALYRRSLAIQPLNITYITLGYAFFTAGRCEEAVWAYDHADLALPVKNPTPDQLRDLLANYRAELPDQCARITLECTSPDLTVALDDARKPTPCANQSVWLSPGAHTLHITTPDGAAKTESLQLRATESRFLPVTAPSQPPPQANANPPIEPPEDAPVPPATPNEPPTLRLYAWIVGGTGLAALTTVAVLDLALFQPTRADLEAAAADDDAALYDQLHGALSQQQTVGRILGVSGALLLAGGVTLYVLGGEEVVPDRAAVGAWWDWNSLGLDYRVAW